MISMRYFRRKNRAQKKEIPLAFTITLAFLVIVLTIPLSAIFLGLTPQGRIDGTRSVSVNKWSEGYERINVQSGAKKGIGEGKYQIPPDPWLHEGYASGVTRWSAPGDYLGTSWDQSIIALTIEPVLSTYDETAYAQGFDVRTGELRWTLEGESPGSCSTVVSGIAYCVRLERSMHTILQSIDLSTGQVTRIGRIAEGIEGDSIRQYHFLGVQGKVTYWSITNESNDEGGDTKLQKILAFGEGRPLWEIVLPVGAQCVLGDGAIGCSTTHNDHKSELVEIFNATTGDKASEFEGVKLAGWHSDGFVLLHGQNYVHYSWAGEKKQTYVTYKSNIWPGEKENSLLPVEAAVSNPQVMAVDAGGKVCVVEPDNDRRLPLRHVPTGKDIGAHTPNVEVRISASGRTIFTGHQPAEGAGEIVFYSRDAEEIARFAVPINEQVIQTQGIIVVSSRDSKNRSPVSTTVYGPRG